jgi:hypothetical protein
VPDTIRVSADVPGGWVGDARVVAEDRTEIEVQSSREFGVEGSLETWVSGKIEGHRRPVEVTVVNDHGNMQFLRPVARLPGASWRHVPTWGRSPRGFQFSVPAADGNAVEFATWWPYTETDHEALLMHLRGCAATRVEPIGETVHGRTIHGAIIGEADRSCLAVVSGFHGGEPSALWATDALLRFAASPEADGLRERVNVVSVPLINLDAVAEGLDRRSAAGINLWLDTDANEAPEVKALDGFLARSPVSAILDIHSWHWVGDGCFTPGWLAVGDELYAKTLELRDCISTRFPLGGHLFFTDDMDCWLTRSCVTHGVATIDAEITLARGSDGAWKTLDRARDDGVAVFLGALDYLDRQA